VYTTAESALVLTHTDYPGQQELYEHRCAP